MGSSQTKHNSGGSDCGYRSKGWSATTESDFDHQGCQPFHMAPSNRSDRASLPAIPVHMVLAEEDAPQQLPSGVKPVCWLLLATFPVETFDDAVRCLRYYSYRWLIERYHFVLKSGCGLEKLQLEAADRIHRALSTYCIVAWRLLWLTYEARYAPDSPCDRVLEIHEAVVLIARLGGFLARKSDGEPGVKTIWRGLRRLHDIASTWALLHDTYPDAVGAVDT